METLEAAEGGLAQRGVELPRRDDRAARARRPGHARLALERERHPEAPREQFLARKQPVRRVAAPLIRLGRLAQADEDEPPLHLVAEAPAQARVGRAGGVRPGTGRVREV